MRVLNPSGIACAHRCSPGGNSASWWWARKPPCGRHCRCPQLTTRAPCTEPHVSFDLVADSRRVAIGLAISPDGAGVGSARRDDRFRRPAEASHHNALPVTQPLDANHGTALPSRRQQRTKFNSLGTVSCQLQAVVSSDGMTSRVSSFGRRGRCVACASSLRRMWLGGAPATWEPLHGFTDVDHTNSECPSVDWLRNRA